MRWKRIKVGINAAMSISTIVVSIAFLLNDVHGDAPTRCLMLRVYYSNRRSRLMLRSGSLVSNPKPPRRKHGPPPSKATVPLRQFLIDHLSPTNSTFPQRIQHNDALRPRKPLLRYPSVHFYRLKHQQQLIHTVSILLVNAVAILSEDRFLARSTSHSTLSACCGISYS